MTEISIDTKHVILQEKTMLYRNTYYSHQVDAQIGQDIGDERMVEAAKENMRKAQQCLDVLERMLSELEASDGENNGD